MTLSDRTYCYRCGTKLKSESDISWYCSKCDYVQYDNPRPCADIAILNSEGELLVSKRALDPGKGKYDMPGGFVVMGESFESAALRELEEETGLMTKDVSSPRYFKSYVAEYAWVPEVYKIVVTLFVVKLVTNKKPVANDDSEELMWLSEDQINEVDWSLPIIKQNAQEVFDSL